MALGLTNQTRHARAIAAAAVGLQRLMHRRQRLESGGRLPSGRRLPRSDSARTAIRVVAPAWLWRPVPSFGEARHGSQNPLRGAIRTVAAGAVSPRTATLPLSFSQLFVTRPLGARRIQSPDPLSCDRSARRDDGVPKTL